MAADVSSLFGIRKGYKDQEQQQQATKEGKSTVLITRDLLGGSSSTIASNELDLHSQVSSGWEKCLDLKSGNVYLQRCTSPTTTSDHKHHKHRSIGHLQDLNFPHSSKPPLNLFDETRLELNLVSSSSSSTANYQSVCTLDKVKSALERAEREKTKRQSVSMANSSDSFSSSSTRENESDCEEKSSSSSFAAGCPNCLFYVLISANNPKCPRCNLMISLPFAMKKPRIDLNIPM